jgi:alpha-tubulin suppressor-like RCC1 family protein
MVTSVTTSGQVRWAYVGQPLSVLSSSAGNNNRALDVGLYHSCRVLTTGAVECWGKNQYGQLGNNTRTDSSAAVRVQGISDAVSVAVGEFHSCARRSGGGLRCWGHGSYVGDATAGDNLTAADVVGMTNVISYSVGNRHSCAAQGTSGAVHCWGLNMVGQLGNGTTTATTTPVSAGLNATAVTAGKFHSCAIQSGLSWNVKCWGNNNSGELGTTSHGSFQTRSVAVPAPSPSFVPSLIAAGSTFTCAMQTGLFGNVACWGKNDKGQLGNNQVGVNTTTAPSIVLGNDLLAQGTACTTHAQCLSGSCVDGVCCNTFCGGAVSTDCQACSPAGGGGWLSAGTCGPTRPEIACTP